MESVTTKNVIGIDGGTLAEHVACAEVGVVIAVVDFILWRNIQDPVTLAQLIRVGFAIHSLDRIIIRDGIEVVNNRLNGVGPEIILVSRIPATMGVEVRSSPGGQEFGFRVAVCNGELFVIIFAVGIDALLQVEFALGDVIGDGDRDGTAAVDAGIGDGFYGPVDLDDLEV